MLAKAFPWVDTRPLSERTGLLEKEPFGQSSLTETSTTGGAAHQGARARKRALRSHGRLKFFSRWNAVGMLLLRRSNG